MNGLTHSHLEISLTSAIDRRARNEVFFQGIQLLVASLKAN